MPVSVQDETKPSVAAPGSRFATLCPALDTVAHRWYERATSPGWALAN